MTLTRTADAFEIERQRNGTVVYLVVHGELDLCGAPLPREATLTSTATTGSWSSTFRASASWAALDCMR
jgi:hypothetical protein